MNVAGEANHDVQETRLQQMIDSIDLPRDVLSRFERAVQTTEPISGLTHSYYRYPARFSPQFAREAILTFSEPGDLVLDPFMGGGTTLVEALAAGRCAIGVDINPLGFFVAKAKTSIVPEEGVANVDSWAKDTVGRNRIAEKRQPSFWARAGYQKDVPWPIRKGCEVILEELSRLEDPAEHLLARCVLLKTAQWAVDCRRRTPCIKEFRLRFILNIRQAADGMRELREMVARQQIQSPTCICLNRSAVGVENAPELKHLQEKPKLVLTSPPYPGVHLLYHQWQVFSRRRTTAPFWIIGSLDGHGSSHYTFGHYQERFLTRYFETALRAFSSIRLAVKDDATVIQLVGFSDPQLHLPRYLEMMERAGFREVALSRGPSGRIVRLWRSVPNRKWYAHRGSEASGSKEVVLAHRPA